MQRGTDFISFKKERAAFESGTKTISFKVDSLPFSILVFNDNCSIATIISDEASSPTIKVGNLVPKNITNEIKAAIFYSKKIFLLDEQVLSLLAENLGLSVLKDCDVFWKALYEVFRKKEGLVATIRRVKEDKVWRVANFTFNPVIFESAIPVIEEACRYTNFELVNWEISNERTVVDLEGKYENGFVPCLHFQFSDVSQEQVKIVLLVKSLAAYNTLNDLSKEGTFIIAKLGSADNFKEMFDKAYGLFTKAVKRFDNTDDTIVDPEKLFEKKFKRLIGAKRCKQFKYCFNNVNTEKKFLHELSVLPESFNDSLQEISLGEYKKIVGQMFCIGVKNI